MIFLDIIHNALLRLSVEDARMDSCTLREIRKSILNKGFIFEIEYMAIPNNFNQELVARLLLYPHADKFDFLLRITDKDQVKWEALIYEGGPSSYYFDDLFYKGKWEGEREFVISGKRSEIEFHVNVIERKITLINTSESKYKAPIFSLFRANAGSQELQDYIRSLPPAVAAIITYQTN